MRLYHASTMIIENPDVLHSRDKSGYNTFHRTFPHEGKQSEARSD